MHTGMNPFLLNNEDVFIDWLTDSDAGAMTHNHASGYVYAGLKPAVAVAVILLWLMPLKIFSMKNIRLRLTTGVVPTSVIFRY